MFLRNAAVGLKSPLTILYSRSILEARIPDMWRVAQVIPIYKGKGDKTDPNSYRPISLASCVGRVLETIIKDQCLLWINQHSMLHASQHEFRSGRSTLTNLLCAETYVMIML